MRLYGIVIAVGLGALAAGALPWLTDSTAAVFCRALQQDSMDRAFCGTYERLADYDAQPETALAWLRADHGEAQGTAAMIVLADWAMRQPQRFLDLLSRLQPEEVAGFSCRLADALVQSGLGADFRAVFQGHLSAGAPLARVFDDLAEQDRVIAPVPKAAPR